MLSEPFVVTIDWIHRHSTRGHGWTRRQLQLLGIPWPPEKGWQARVAGRTLTPEAHDEFVTIARASLEVARGTCEVLMYGNPGEVDADPPSLCGGPARFRYPAMGGGYMRLCTAHGEQHDRPSSRHLEVWTYAGWTPANP